MTERDRSMIRYFDMFAGIGGFRAGLTRAGGFQCIGHCEIDKYADASYRAIHTPGKEELYYPDARTIDPDTMPDFDLLCGGFPCHAFSTAGKRLGFEDSRGTLFFEIARLAAARRPSYLLLENVRFQTWGTASNGWCLTAKTSAYPSQDEGCTLSAILIEDAPEKYYLSQAQIEKLLFKSSAALRAPESTTQMESPAL